MKTISLIKEPFLESLVAVKNAGVVIDLHNDFTCDSICVENKKIIISFVSEKRERVFIYLLGADIIKQSISFDFSGPIILDNFYKGRVLVGDTLKDVSEDGRYCFYVHFYEELYFEILTKDVILAIESPQGDEN